jgi:drug/metabolite transporter (DMT)-like permease
MLLATAAIFGTNYVVMKWALLGAGPLTVTLYRAAFGAAAMGAIAMARGISLKVPLRRDDLMAIAIPSALMLVSQLAFAIGVDGTGAGLAALISNTMPVFSVLLAWAILREHPTRSAIVGIALAGGGVALAASVAHSSRTSTVTGVLVMLLAVLSWATANVALKRRRPVGGEIVFTFWMLVAAAVVVVPIAGIGEGFAADWSWKFLGEMLFSGSLGQVGYLLLLIVLARGSVLRASMATYMVPVFAIVAGALLLDEEILLQEILGGVLIFAGVGLVLFRGSRAAAAGRAAATAAADREAAG